MIEVSNPQRVVFPEVAKTKADVVAYYERIAARALPHLRQRPLSIRRFPKGLGAPGFFQKNVPAHYPESFQRFAVPRSHAASKKHGKPGERPADVTLYPLVDREEQLPYLANQGAIELHVPTARAPEITRPDRFIMDLDPPPGELALVRRAARSMRARLEAFGLPSVPIATGSKGYHVVAAIEPRVLAEELALAAHQLATLAAAAEPDALTVTYRVAERGGRVFLDFLRNNPLATVVAPYSLRATPRASVAVPLTWEELDAVAPNAFGIDDAERLAERPDALAELASRAVDPRPFVERVAAAFAASGLVLEVFDRFRS